jgi:ankyrin repeat protein
MLTHGADVNATDEDGMTPLYYTVMLEADNTTLRKLLASGADPNFVAKDRVTPMLLAKEQRRPDIVALLKQAAARK